MPSPDPGPSRPVHSRGPRTGLSINRGSVFEFSVRNAYEPTTQYRLAAGQCRSTRRRPWPGPGRCAVRANNLSLRVLAAVLVMVALVANFLLMPALVLTFEPFGPAREQAR